MIHTLRRILFREKRLLSDYEKRNPKVCMIVWNAFVTDARVTREAKTLIDAGKNVTVIAVHEPGKTKKHEINEKIKIVRVSRALATRKYKIQEAHNNVLQKESKSKTRITRKIKPFLRVIVKWSISVKFLIYALRERAGLYHAHDLNTLIPAYIASRIRGTRLIYDAHEISTDRAGWGNKRFWYFVEKLLIRKADAVITTNLTRAQYFKETYGIPLPTLVHNVPEYINIKSSNLIRDKLSIPANVPVILYQGGIQRERGLENLILSMNLVEGGVLVLIGDGALKKTLVQMVYEQSLEDRVYFMDAVPMNQLLYYTASADIGMQVLQNTCFNHYSACSNKLFEYIMAGIPVIASDLPEMRKVIDSTKTGILIDPSEPKNIAEAINRLLLDKQLYDLCRKNTRKASMIYNWDKEKNNLLMLYNT